MNNPNTTSPVTRPSAVNDAMNDETILGLPSETIAYILKLEASQTIIDAKSTQAAYEAGHADGLASQPKPQMDTMSVGYANAQTRELDEQRITQPAVTSGAVDALEAAQKIVGLTKQKTATMGFGEQEFFYKGTEQQAAAIIQQAVSAAYAKGQEDYRVSSIAVLSAEIAKAKATPLAADGKLREALELAETEMRYAGFANDPTDNVGQKPAYEAVVQELNKMKATSNGR